MYIIRFRQNQKACISGLKAYYFLRMVIFIFANPLRGAIFTFAVRKAEKGLNNSSNIMHIIIHFSKLFLVFWGAFISVSICKQA